MNKIADSIFFYILQLLHWVIPVNNFLRCFHMWNCVNVPLLCQKIALPTQHFFHNMDCNSANRNDGHFVAFKGMPVLYLKHEFTCPEFQLEVVKSYSDIKFSRSKEATSLL